jgi:HEAT repeat protein
LLRQLRRLDEVDARTKRFAAVVVLAFLVAAAVVWRFLRRVEPIYNGKSLTFWAQQYGSNNWSGRKELAREAEFAVRQIGTNAILFLLDLMQARDSDLKKRLRQHVPRKWHDSLHLNDNSDKVRRIGAHGLAALGTNAPAAVFPLIELARQHPNEDGRYIAVFALRTLGPAAEPAIPFYLQCLTNKDNTIRNEAAVGLARIPHRRETTLPAILKYLESIENSDGWELYSAIELLGRFGTNAKPAVPRLLSLLNDSNPRVREAVTNSLLWIDPDAAEKARVRRRW